MRRSCFRVTIGVMLIFLASVSARAQEAATLRFAELGDVRLENGQTIRQCRIGYRTFGALNADKSNVVLLTTWFTGTSQNLIGSVGPGRLVDSSRHFVVVADALGNGVSSSPSNSKLQPGAVFPHFTIRDMVNTQHRLLTEKLGLRHVRAVIGISMGGMQTFEWVVAYPGFMDAAVPLVGTPRQSAFDLMLWQAQLRLIESSRGSVPGAQDSVVQAIAAMTLLHLRTPTYHATRTKPESVPTLLEEQEKAVLSMPLEDRASQLRAMIGHDIYKRFGGSAERTAAAVRARVLVIVSASDQMVNPLPALEFAKLLRARTLTLTGDYGHLATIEQGEMIRAVMTPFLQP